MKTAILLFALLGFHTAFAGQRTGNGGDAIEIEFRLLGMRIVDFLNSADRPTRLSDINTADLSRAVQETKIVAKNQTLYDRHDQARTAVNYPAERRIELNRDGWAALKYSFDEKLVLVLHEYLGILENEVDNYDLSSRIAGSSETIRATGVVTGGTLFHSECRISAELEAPPYLVQALRQKGYRFVGQGAASARADALMVRLTDTRLSTRYSVIENFALSLEISVVQTTTPATLLSPIYGTDRTYRKSPMHDGRERAVAKLADELPPCVAIH